MTPDPAKRTRRADDTPAAPEDRDEGPLESLGHAIAAPVIGSPGDAPGRVEAPTPPETTPDDGSPPPDPVPPAPGR